MTEEQFKSLTLGALVICNSPLLPSRQGSIGFISSCRYHQEYEIGSVFVITIMHKSSNIVEDAYPINSRTCYLWDIV